MALRRDTPVRGQLFVRKELVAKEELARVAGKIDEMRPDGRFGVTLEMSIGSSPTRQVEMRRHRICTVVRDHVHMEMMPYDLTNGRIIYRERRPGQGPVVVRQRMIRR